MRIFQSKLVLEFQNNIILCLQNHTMAIIRVEWGNGRVNDNCCPETNTIIRHLPSAPSFWDCELADKPHQPEEQHRHACLSEIRSIQCSCGVNDPQAFFSNFKDHPCTSQQSSNSESVSVEQQIIESIFPGGRVQLPRTYDSEEIDEENGSGQSIQGSRLPYVRIDSDGNLITTGNQWIELMSCYPYFLSPTEEYIVSRLETITESRQFVFDFRFDTENEPLPVEVWDKIRRLLKSRFFVEVKLRRLDVSVSLNGTFILEDNVLDAYMGEIDFVHNRPFTLLGSFLMDELITEVHNEMCGRINNHFNIYQEE